MTEQKIDLHKLSRSEFARLCFDLLKKRGFSDLELTEKGRGAEILGTHNSERIAAKVKHTRQLIIPSVIGNVEKFESMPSPPARVLILTSATVSTAQRSQVSSAQLGTPVELIGRDDIIDFIKQQPALLDSHIKPAQRRNARQLRELSFSVLAGILSILAALSSVFSMFRAPDRGSLQDRIQGVESALTSLKTLEQDLTKIKKDMVATEEAARVIEQEYERAKELEAITSEQYDSIRDALRTRSWKLTILDYGLGFILGVAASVAASVLLSWVRQRRALANDS
ncbi:MAG: restriction endonuclease [Planctomycetota bacterium]